VKSATLPPAEPIVISVEAPEFGGVRKAARFLPTDSVAKVIDEFAVKLGVPDASAYSLFYAMYGLGKSYEVEMNRGKDLGVYANNILLSPIMFRRY